MPEKTKIHVCSKGKRCSKRDSDKVLKLIKLELKTQQVEDKVEVCAEGCMGLCSTGPTVIVTPDGTQYGGVTEADAAEIVRVHANGAKPIDRLLASNVRKKK
ncbi:MAG: (2Fe-2S) ferredoxin domain-containing protein [Candidatus Obscuribacterales bacterium]|nr:(2Fe-2S) ferredoxin domain-containing protein [Candidatus Obscuribacterales bacterium]